MACSTYLLFGTLLSLSIEFSIKSISRRDARQLPDVVRVSNPYEEPEPPPAAVSAENTIQSCLPSEIWREVFEFKFQNFRKVRYLYC